jgi:serine/threonine-protein kinase RsbW
MPPGAIHEDITMEATLPSCEFDPDKLILKLDMTVPAQVNDIDRVVTRVVGLISDMECASGKEFEVEIAMREALANAIVHGCRQDPDKEVRICVACDESRGMLIVVKDPGTGFDPARIPSPIVGRNVYSTHGRGIFLIDQLMDEVRILKGGTEIHMLKK